MTRKGSYSLGPAVQCAARSARRSDGMHGDRDARLAAGACVGARSTHAAAAGVDAHERGRVDVRARAARPEHADRRSPAAAAAMTAAAAAAAVASLAAGARHVGGIAAAARASRAAFAAFAALAAAPAGAAVPA